MLRPFIALIAALTLSAPIAAYAQSNEDLTEEQLREEAMKKREAAEIRIEEDMVKMTSLVEAMARTLGQLHYLRTLCFGANDQLWRESMARMLDIEAPGDATKQSELTQAFNAGYYLEEARHTACSPELAVDVAALSENGRSIATMLGDPYREIE